jgi:hypothetical protein
VNSKVVLIVTYYWPPAGGPGVQRWLNFARWLPESGIVPIIYTPENPSYPLIDETLISQVPVDMQILRTRIKEPYRIAEWLNPKSKEYKAGLFEENAKQSLLTRFQVYVRGNYFIPDARKFWVKPSVKFLSDYLIEHKIDRLITTGPPHSMHLIGLELKKQNPNLKWMADFRDPWTQISYHKALKLTKNSRRKHQNLEKAVLQSADCIIATSFTDAKSYRKLGARRTEVITNGYEAADFEFQKIVQNENFRITYSGNLEMARNPLVLWQALRELTIENQGFRNELKLNFYGNISTGVEESLVENKLEDFVVKHGYVSHQQSVEGIVNAELLFLTNFQDEASKGIIPGKLFEYLAAQNPILALGPPKGDVSEILNQTGAGEYFVHSDLEGVKNYIIEIYHRFKSEQGSLKTKGYEQFSRSETTKKLAGVINSV